jgi:hypothetical protein
MGDNDEFYGVILPWEFNTQCSLLWPRLVIPYDIDEFWSRNDQSIGLSHAKTIITYI